MVRHALTGQDSAHRSGTPVPAGRILILLFGYAVAMGGTTMPTPIYPWLQQAYDLSTAASTQLFAVYALCVLCVLILFGSLSDTLGRRTVLWLGLAAAVGSGACYVLADGASLLFTARILSGVCAGLVTGTATAYITDLAGSSVRGAGLSSAANMIGLGSGPIFTALIATVLPGWMMAPFALHAVLCCLCAGLLLSVPETLVARWPSVSLSFPRVPRASLGDFMRGGSMTLGFAVMGGCTALSAILIVRAFGLDQIWLLGAVGSLIFAATALGQRFGARYAAAHPRCGFLGLAGGAALIAAAPQWPTGAALACYLLGLALAGASHGMLFPTGLAIVLRSIQPRQRAGVSSAFWVLGYALTALGALVLGWLSTALDERWAITLFGGAVLLTALAVQGRDPRASRTSKTTEHN
ncbi:MFS transporter [Glutamicibacter endophyticus]